MKYALWAASAERVRDDLVIGRFKALTTSKNFITTQSNLLLRLYTLDGALADRETTSPSACAETIESRFIARYLAEVGVEESNEAVACAFGNELREFAGVFEVALSGGKVGECDRPQEETEQWLDSHSILEHLSPCKSRADTACMRTRTYLDIRPILHAVRGEVQLGIKRDV